MGLKQQDHYWPWIQRISDDKRFYKTIFWVLDDGPFCDEDEKERSAEEVLHLVLTTRPEYIAFDDLRYIRQDKLDDSDWLQQYAKETVKD